MVYSNTAVSAIAREMDFGTLHQIQLGEYGRGRKLMTITCQHPDMNLKKNFMHENLNIGTTRSGKPKLVNQNVSTELYLVLSSQGGYTRRGNGYILTKKEDYDNFEVIGRGNGADGDAGGIGYWDVRLLKVKDISKDFVIRVRTSGGGYGTPSDFYQYHNGVMYHFIYDDIRDFYDTMEMDIPFYFSKHYGIKDEEWQYFR